MTPATRRKERHRAVPMLPEVRRIEAQNLEIRESTTDASGDTVDVQGMWCVYNTPYAVRDVLGEFQERMLPGVCGDLLTRADVRFLVDHDSSRIMARTKSGTMRLFDSDLGAMMNATLDLRDSDAQNTVVRLERGDVSQMSCGFIVARDSWNDAFDERDVELFRDLLDVSSVTYPASPTTDLAIAKRMIEAGPIESRARVRQFYIEARAGKMLSAKNASKITDAVTTLHELLDDANPPEASEPDVDEREAVVVDDAPSDVPEDRAVERRDAASYSDIEQQVSSALADHLADRGITNPDFWLDDCGDDWAVFTLWPNCQSYKITYEMGDDGSVTFGEYDAVDRVTSWQPVAERDSLIVTEDASVSEARSKSIRLRVMAGDKRRV